MKAVSYTHLDVYKRQQEGSNNAGMVRLLEILLQWFMDGGLTNVLIDVLTNHVSFEFDNREIARLIEKYA